MGKRYLTDHEIYLLRQFLIDRDIRAIDILVEILDHYALLIEDELNENSTLDFNQALRITHKKSGGNVQLRKLVRSRTKSIDKYWKRRIRVFMKGYFEWPRIIAFLGISLFFFLITYDSESLYNKQPLLTTIAFTITSSLIMGYVIMRRLKYAKTWSVNTLYTYQAFYTRIMGTMMTNACLFLPLWSNCDDWFPENEIPVTILLIIMSCIAAYELLLAHAFETQFQYWIKEELETKYPEHLDLIK